MALFRWFTRTTTRQRPRELDDSIVEDSAVDSTQAGSTKRKRSDNEASAANSDEDGANSPPEEPSTSRSKPKVQSINELEKSNEDLSDLKISKSGSQSHIQNTAGRTVSVNAVATHNSCVLSRPMQRKLVMLINCQLVEEEGRSRAARAARSLGERTVTELILAHQNPQQLSANLWAAVRTRGCQFLGPGMQEEVLRLILLALEDGSALSRKVLVLFVVQRLEKQYPQASKTAIGHVVQLLYRASCFRVTKREEESSLMQLKEEFRTYEALRLEHDAQIVQIAMEAGLRISPEQWSSLLYGDTTHKSHMQSIIDKHQSPQSFAQGINELVMALQRTGDPCNLLGLKPHLDFLAKIDPSPDCPAPSWEDLEAVMKSLKIIIQGLVDFVMRYNHRKPEIAPQQNARYKTSMCRDFSAKRSCPRGATCTFAHSQDELEKYRSRSKKLSHRSSGSVSAFASLTPKQKLELAQVQESSRQKMETTMGKPGANFPEGNAMMPDSAAGAAAQLTAQMVGLAVNPGLPQPPAPPLAPGTGFPMGTGPGGAFPLVQPQLPTNNPMMRPVNPLNPGGAPEGMPPEQLQPYPQQVPMRLPTAAELGVPYHNPHMPTHPMQGPSPPLMSSTIYRVGTPVMSPAANLQPQPQPLPGAVQAPLSEVLQAPAAPCPHMRIPGELVQAQSGTMYAVGTVPNPAMVPVPEQHFVVGPGGDLQAVAPAPPNVPVMPNSGIYSAFGASQPSGFALVTLPVVDVQSDLDPDAPPFAPVVEETAVLNTSSRLRPLTFFIPPTTPLTPNSRNKNGLQSLRCLK
ncbi:hypothetical protein BaRGS_00020700 [Batillaria attramentaria]|uniref:RING-type E3 ubiquitin transferase n=1 Tax=Batillaria attramentaria TaxID=370345 RepID=A0ABD0KLT9_9CAEN